MRKITALGAAILMSSSVGVGAVALNVADAQPAEAIIAPRDPNSMASKKMAIYKKALTKKGAPYVWGARGPSSFDCSGLVQWAYQSTTGKSFEPNTGTQIYSSKIRFKSNKVSYKRVAKFASVGDLVYMYGANGQVSHVGFYAGGNRIYNASQSSGKVTTLPMSYFSKHGISTYRVATWR